MYNKKRLYSSDAFTIRGIRDGELKTPLARGRNLDDQSPVEGA
jgi:hypothetical protein